MATSGSSIRTAWSEAPRSGGPTSQAWTGRDFPFTAKGASDATEKQTAESAEDARRTPENAEHLEDPEDPEKNWISRE